LQVGESLDYSLPPWKDKDGDKVTVSASLSEGPPPPFVTFNNPSFNFKPILEQEAGTYAI